MGVIKEIKQEHYMGIHGLITNTVLSFAVLISIPISYKCCHNIIYWAIFAELARVLGNLLFFYGKIFTQED